MSIHKRLYYYASWLYLTLSLVRATLPSELLSSVPICSLDCVELVVQQEYSGLCPEPFALDCLCTEYGSSGYALDDSISGCIQSPNCNFTDPFNTTPPTNICGQTPQIITSTVSISFTEESTPTTAFATPTSSTAATSTGSAMSNIPPPTTTVPAGATASVGADGVSVKGQLNLTMAQIAGITIAAAALLILTVGIFSCVFFVRKRNKRLEQEDRKILMQSTPKSTTDMQDMQDMQDLREMYFPPPPTSPGRLVMAKKERSESPRLSIFPRKRSKEMDEENFPVPLPAPPELPQRTWPRYYPIMPDQNLGIGIATTTNHSQPVVPVPSPTYPPVSAPAPSYSAHPATMGRSTSPVPNFSLSRNASTATLPTYQPHSSYTHNVHQQYPQPQPQPQPLAASYVPHLRTQSQSSRAGRAASNSRRSKAFSFMTDIEEGEQVSTRETSLAEMSGGSSSESLPSSSSSKTGPSPSMKKSRRPTLTINIPGQPKSKMEFPPPPPAKNSVRMPTVLPGPPPQKEFPRVANTAMAPQMPPHNTGSAQVRSTPPMQQGLTAPSVRSTPPLPRTPEPAARGTPPVIQTAVMASIAASPPRQQGVRRNPSNSSAPMLQALASRASQRSAARPKPALSLNTEKPNPVIQAIVAKPSLVLDTQKTAAKRPPLLREDQVQQIANSPSDILKAANSYARARKESPEAAVREARKPSPEPRKKKTRRPSPVSTNRDSMSSTALPSSNVLGPSTFLLSDSERATDRNASTRSNSSARRASRGPSRGGRRASDADSVTSFEDDCSESEDETPPKEENRSLSPVIESSPVTTLRYPKVPRQANQVVPRSPGTPKNAQQPNSPARLSTPTRNSNQSRPEVNTAAAANATQGIGNRLWKTELSPSNGKPMHRRSESWENWAQNTPNSDLSTPKPAFARGGLVAPKLTPTRRGDELFLDLRFSAATIGPASPKRPTS